jgi:hypothetical protein
MPFYVLLDKKRDISLDFQKGKNKILFSSPLPHQSTTDYTSRKAHIPSEIG